MSVSWHPTRWWYWWKPENKKKKEIHFLFMENSIKLQTKYICSILEMVLWSMLI